jgi:TPR repeat protein
MLRVLLCSLIIIAFAALAVAHQCDASGPDETCSGPPDEPVTEKVKELTPADIEAASAVATEFISHYRKHTEQLAGKKSDPLVVTELLAPFCKSTVGVPDDDPTELADWTTDFIFARAMCHATGNTVKTSMRRAIELSIAAARRGQTDACTFLGIHHQEGTAVKQDHSRAARFFQLAVDQGHIHATFLLASAISDGLGVQQSDKDAFQLFETAAKAGHVESQLVLGMCLAEGIGVEANQQKALEPFTKAAAGGHPTAQYILGEWYDEGTVVAKDHKRAMDLFMKASKRSHPDSLLKMYHRLSEGLYGVEKNEAVAFEFVQQAAEVGVAKAQYLAGMHLLEGRGVAADREKALKFLNKAADQGNKDAITALNSLPAEVETTSSPSAHDHDEL